MADKAISDLTEIFAIDPDDYLVVETAAGNTRKIKKSNIAIEGRVQPTFVQKGTLRLDGTISLPVAPTVGNLMVLVTAGFGTSLPSYAPAGFTQSGQFSSNASNSVMVWTRRVVSGDTGSYAISASDNQQAVLYEFENAGGAFGVTGGVMSSYFTGNNFSIGLPGSPFGTKDIMLAAFEHDTTPTWSITGETGWTTDFTPGADGQNHQGAFGRYDPTTFDGVIAGSLSSTPNNPVFGVFAVVGKAA